MLRRRPFLADTGLGIVMRFQTRKDVTIDTHAVEDIKESDPRSQFKIIKPEAKEK